MSSWEIGAVVMISVGVVCWLMALGLMLWGRHAVRQNQMELKARKQKPEFGVLVPARDESKVIAGLLESLKQQTVKVDFKNVYVIVERRDDPTVEIAKNYGAQVFVRPKVTAKRARKGYALDEAIRAILKKRHFDLYFIFDADNVLEKNFVAEMLKCYAAGYEIATGYRNAKNGNANLIAAASCLTFSMINTIVNRERVKYQANMVFSGTGYYIDGKLIDRWQGWPFHSLTEDYEISLYATLHGLTTFYNEAAVFYDEQPVRYAQTVAQRVRWIKGYFSARRQYIPLMREKCETQNHGSLVKERIGVNPAIIAVVGFVLITLGGMMGLMSVGRWGLGFGFMLAMLALLYIVLFGLTGWILRQEKLDLSREMKMKLMLMNPIYLVTYVPCALKALLKREVAWVKIEHGS